MSQTYQTCGIVLSRKNLGENDRLVTLLTPDFGLVRAIAPGARKYRSSLGGRVELFVVNDLLIVKGRSIDRIIQAQTIASHARLAQDLGKLTASQYLAELVLCMGLSEQPQVELYNLLLEHLTRLEGLTTTDLIIPYLTQAVFHFLTLAGVAPTVERCFISQQNLQPDFNQSQADIGFSFANGGVFKIGSTKTDPQAGDWSFEAKLGAIELSLLQDLGKTQSPNLDSINLHDSWCKLEQMLRRYTEYHFNYTFRSSILVNSLSQIEF